MNSETRKIFLNCYLERMNEQVKNKVTGNVSTYRNHIFASACYLVSCLRAGKEYVPFEPSDHGQNFSPPSQKEKNLRAKYGFVDCCGINEACFQGGGAVCAQFYEQYSSIFQDIFHKFLTKFRRVGKWWAQSHLSTAPEYGTVYNYDSPLGG